MPIDALGRATARIALMLSIIAIAATNVGARGVFGPRAAPAAPTNPQATLDAQGRVVLSWVDNSTDELGFRIIRDQQTGSTWGNSAGFTVGANVTSYVDNPAPGVYRYRLRAYNQRGNSSYSPRVEITVPALSQIPAAPTNLAVTDAGGGIARVTWTDNASNETGFEIERQPAFASPQVVAANIVTYSDSTSGGTFAYRVRAVNAAGQSGFTPWLQASIQPPAGGPAPSPIQAVIPGSGFSGPTPQPAPVGDASARGYDAKAIARWDVVPYQTFTSDFNIGVVAFHVNGIDRVEFSANGGPWVPVREMQLNPQSGVWEYTAQLRGADYVDGPLEVRAVAWPLVGVPRVLESVTFTANASGSTASIEKYVSPAGSDTTGDGTVANPYRSINKAAKVIETAQGGNADGGIIYLQAGDHTWGEAGRDSLGAWIGYPVTNTRFLTIRSAPGTSPGDVRISAGLSGGVRTKLVTLRGVKIVGVPLDNAPPPTGGSPVIWIDQCSFTSNDPIQQVNWASSADWTGGVFVTSATVTASANGWQEATLARNIVIDGIGNDALINCRCVINAEVRNIVNPPASDFHSDVIQLFTVTPAFENLVFYNIRAVNNNAQGFHIGYTGHIKGPEWSDVAIVNMVNDFASPTAQWIPDINHLLLWNLTFPSMLVDIRDNPLGEPTTIRNLSVRNCVFNRFALDVTGGPSRYDPSWAHDNHFIDTTTYGTMTVGDNFTTGGSLVSIFANAGAQDFRPAPGSPLRTRVSVPLVPEDAANMPLLTPASIGGLQP
jgi:hypothetical protein